MNVKNRPGGRYKWVAKFGMFPKKMYLTRGLIFVEMDLWNALLDKFRWMRALKAVQGWVKYIIYREISRE